MGPASYAQLLKEQGALGVAGLCVAAMVALFVWLMRLQGLRIADRDKHIQELAAAHASEVATLKQVLPVADRLALAVTVIERRQKKPPTPQPALPSEVAK